jgi:hypothetical protein
VIATKFGFASNPGVLAMDTIYNDVCVLVAAAFALTLVPGLGISNVLCYQGAIKERFCWYLRFWALSKKPLFHTPACSTNESWRYARPVW